MQRSQVFVGVQYLRGIAAMLVVLHHASSAYDGGINPLKNYYAPAAGVDVFFVISGFILGLPFARHRLLNEQPVSIGKYFLRRLTRLEPPYIASYLIAAALFGVYTHGHGIDRIYLRHVLAGIFYLNGMIFHDQNPANVVTWSLEIEVQFYILAPILALLFSVRNPAFRRVLFIVIIAAFGFIQALVLRDNEVAKISIVFYVQYFLAGFLLADVYLHHLMGRTGSLWIDAAALAGWLAYFLVPYSPAAHALFPFLLVFLCGAALCPGYSAIFFSNKTIAVIGGMCYSIYLLHFLFIAVFFKVTRHLIIPGDYLVSFFIQLVATGIPVLALSAVYYASVERVFMNPDWPTAFRRKLRKAITTKIAAPRVGD